MTNVADVIYQEAMDKRAADLNRFRSELRTALATVLEKQDVSWVARDVETTIGETRALEVAQEIDVADQTEHATSWVRDRLVRLAYFEWLVPEKRRAELSAAGALWGRSYEVERALTSHVIRR
jgi:hypothetical protein